MAAALPQHAGLSTGAALRRAPTAVGRSCPRLQVTCGGVAARRSSGGQAPAERLPSGDSSPCDAPSTSSSSTSRRALLFAAADAGLAVLAIRAAGPASAAEGFQDELGAILSAPTSTPADGAAAAAAAAAGDEAGAGAAAAAATPEAPAAAAPEAAAAPAAPSRVVTPEGDISLATYDEATRNMTPTDKQIFSLNARVQAQNRAPDDFPIFIREGFNITVVGQGYTMQDNGLIYRDFLAGSGPQPVDGQQVIFDYTGYNESGAVIDTSYRKGRAAEVRLGINGLIPGFELGIKGMRPGGRRRIVVPPALGPPVGPSTFFSAKQCEVFDVELRAVKSCQRRQMAMFSDVVCE